MADTPAEGVVGIPAEGVDTRFEVEGRVGTPAPAVGLVIVEPGCQQTPHRNTLCMELLHRYLDKTKSMPAPVHG